MTSDILHKSVDVNVNDDAEEENSSFFDDFCEGVWEGFNSKLAKCLIAIQILLIIASLLVVLGMSQHRLIQLLVNTYDHVKHDADESDAKTSSFNSNNLAHFIGQKIGSALFKKYMSTSSSSTSNHNTAAVLSGSIPILIARIMGAPIPTAAKSVGRLLTFAGQTTPITYKPLTWNDRYMWAQAQCNFSIQYPTFYGDSTCCYQTRDVCCPNSYDPQYCYQSYDQYSYPYMCYYCLYPPSPTFKDNMMATMSMFKSFVATFYYAQQVPLPASVSTAASAMSPLALPQALDFIAAQGDLNPLVHLGEIPCTDFISSVKKVTWSGTFSDGDNQVRNWNVESDVNSITSTMSEVCSKIASAKPAAGETLPPAQRRITPSPAALDETEKQQVDNNNNNSSSPSSPSPSSSSSSSSSQESPHTRAMKILTFVFAGLIIVLSLVLIVILVRSIFSWWSCSDENNNNATTNEHEEEQEDLVYELFHRRHNQILLLINCILVLAIAFTCVSAVSYSDFLHKAEDFIHRHTENPQELGIDVAKALFKVHQSSSKKNKNLKASTTTNEPLLGFFSNFPQLVKNAMLINIPELSWHVSDFTSHLDARVAYSCRDRDTQQQLPSYCKNGVSDIVRSVAGSSHNSLVNFVFGSYLGNVAVTEKKEASDSSSSMFGPISMVNWAGTQLSANSNYLQLNSTSCHPFVKSLKALTLSGTWNDASNGNSLVVWDAQSTKTAVAAALSEICSEAAAADVATTTTTTTAAPPTQTPSPGSSPTTTTATTGPGGSTVAPAPPTTATTTTTTTTQPPLSNEFKLVFNASQHAAATRSLAQFQTELQQVLTSSGSVHQASLVRLVIVSNNTDSTTGAVSITFKLEATTSSSAATTSLQEGIKALNEASPDTVASTFGASSFAAASNNNDTPSPNGGDDDKSSPPLSTGAIAGIAAGAGLLILILVVVLYKKNSANRENNVEVGMQNFEVGVVQAQQQQQQRQSAYNELQL